ncbi:hypothetical protein DXG01_007516 [Tephrocybe rancida]|nr:hypothetical protein DXG01_007516 [Tephrocybe rancida]
MPAAHDIYAELLRALQRGHPLYYPEPALDDGPMQIGDVGFLKQGAFYRLFNVSRARDDPSQRFGVPDGFEPLNLGFVRSYDAALEAGPLHSKTVSTLEANVGVPGVALPLDASFHFQCTSKRGAILMQETQMKREEAVQTQLLEDYLYRHCQSWYDFAKRNHFALGFGQIMLVTECSKTAAWSSAVYSNSTKEFGISFSVGNAFVPCSAKLSASAAIERTGSIERRRSAQRPCPTGDGSQPPKDHTVFFKAFHLGTRQAYKQSLISLFTHSRNSKIIKPGDKLPDASTSNAGPFGANDSEPHSPSEGPLGPALNQYLTGITYPDLPDFHPASPLLAMMMENTDAQCAIVHDNEWCSPTPEASQLIEEYTQFHFNDCGALMDLALHPQISPQPLEEELDDVYHLSMTTATTAQTPLPRSSLEDYTFGRAMAELHRPSPSWITPDSPLDDIYPTTTTAAPVQTPLRRSSSEDDTFGGVWVERHRRSVNWMSPNFLLDDVYSSTTTGTPVQIPLPRSSSEDDIFGTTPRVIPPDVPRVACKMPRPPRAEHPDVLWEEDCYPLMCALPARRVPQANHRLVSTYPLLDGVHQPTTTATPAQIPPPPPSSSEDDTFRTTLPVIPPEVPREERGRNNFDIHPTLVQHQRLTRPSTAPQKLTDHRILSAAKNDPISSERHGNTAGLRACRRCKTLELKCEYKADTDSCNRCIDGGHNCEASKMRGPPNREELLEQIRQHSVQIRDLMAELTNHDSPSSSAIPTESSSKPNIDTEDWTTRAKKRFDAFCVFLWDMEDMPRRPTDDLTRVGPTETDDEYSDKSDYDLKTADARFISDDEDFVVINECDCVEDQGVNEVPVREKGILGRQGSFLDTQGHVSAHEHRPKERESSTELKPEENVSGAAAVAPLWQSPEELIRSTIVDGQTGPSSTLPYPSPIFEEQTSSSDDRVSHSMQNADINDHEWQHDTNSAPHMH